MKITFRSFLGFIFLIILTLACGLPPISISVGPTTGDQVTPTQDLNATLLTITPIIVQSSTKIPPAIEEKPVYIDPCQIAFSSERNRFQVHEIYLMNPDGSNVRQLTNVEPGEPGNWDVNPQWSPDGTQIVFEAHRADESTVGLVEGTVVVNEDSNKKDGIWVVDTATGDERELVPPDYENRNPAWSPDGKQIVFSSNRDGDIEIFSIDANGTNLQQLTENSADDNYPVWSPDGNRIAFYSNRDGVFGLFVMNADGRDQRRLVEVKGLSDVIPVEAKPVWSPDGKYIAFAGDGMQLFMVNADNSQVTQLTTDNKWISDPSWSPDSIKITFTTKAKGGYAVFIVDINTKTIEQISVESDWIWETEWSKDGTQILYSAEDVNGDTEIFIKSTVGMIDYQLTQMKGTDWEATWSPLCAKN